MKYLICCVLALLMIFSFSYSQNLKLLSNTKLLKTDFATASTGTEINTTFNTEKANLTNSNTYSVQFNDFISDIPVSTLQSNVKLLPFDNIKLEKLSLVGSNTASLSKADLSPSDKPADLSASGIKDANFSNHSLLPKGTLEVINIKAFSQLISTPKIQISEFSVNSL